MNNTRRFALVASVFVLLGTHHTLAAPRAIPGFAFDGKVDNHDVLVPITGGREPMDQANLATRLHPSLRADTLRFDDAPRSGETTRRIFPSSWWPMSGDGIAARWNSRIKDYSDWATDRDNVSAAEKYDQLFFPDDARRLEELRAFTQAEMRRPPRERGAGILRPAVNVVGPTTAWELSNHGTYQRTYPDAWWGHCNGWSSYVSSERDNAPLRDIRVRSENGSIVECAEANSGCVLFHMADIEALMSEIYFHDSSTIAGRRCNTPKDAIVRDDRGRPVDPACRDLNPATFHLALTGLLGRGAAPLADLSGTPEKLPFVIDYAYNDEVWSFPVTGYEIRSAEYVTETQASRLVCNGTGRAAGCREYQWNENATRFAKVETAIYMMTYETAGETLLSAPLDRQAIPTQSTYRYVLELDGRGAILGGEWIASPTGVGNNSKELHPDFMFMSVQPEAMGEDADDRNGRTDNPFISSTNVKELLRISRSQANR